MKYALVKFRAHLLGSKPFVIYLLPHLSQRMARWLSFFAEYNFEVKYKPGKQNALADALSRRPHYAYNYSAKLSSSAFYLIGSAYVTDDHSVDLLCSLGNDELKDSEIKLLALACEAPSIFHRSRAVVLLYRCDRSIAHYDFS